MNGLPWDGRGGPPLEICLQNKKLHWEKDFGNNYEETGI